VGAIFAPTLHGVRYSGGLYHERPTALHVSRGISALNPIRWNCPPELAKLVLKSGQ
jgi:predicted MPP superfamily phosphohydrolase